MKLLGIHHAAAIGADYARLEGGIVTPSDLSGRLKSTTRNVSLISYVYWYQTVRRSNCFLFLTY